jgi:diaminopimelate decarboxylase
MTAFSRKDGVLHVEDMPLPQLAKEVGTPAYIYSTKAIKEQYAALDTAIKAALPEKQAVRHCYACKANSSVAILALLRSLGSNLETVSEGEIRRGLAAGFKPEQIVFTGVGKTVAELTFAIEQGIHQINVESVEELQRIDIVSRDLKKSIPVVFRLNPDLADAAFSAKTSTGGKRDKFGITSERLLEAYEMSQDMPFVDAVGISVHIGSQVTKVAKFEEAFAKIPELVHTLRDKGYTVSRIDIGGGFPIIYNDEDLLDLDKYARWVNDIIVPLDVEILTEPGRYYVGNAGVLLTQVEYVKHTQVKDFLVLDSSMSELIRPTLYNAYHGIEPVENADRPLHSYDVVGGVCESGDTFTKDRKIPEMKQGELAAITSAGAYGFAMASNYNTRPLPPEVLVHGDTYTIIRPRQEYEDIIGCDIIPDWLKD